MPQNAASKLRILIVDDELNIRKTLAMSLELDGHEVLAVSNAVDAVAEASRRPLDVAFVDVRLGSTLGLDLIPELLSQSPWMRIVIITAHGTIDNAVSAMRLGATDYLTKPFTPAQVKLVVQRVAQLRGLEHRLATLNSSAAPAEARRPAEISRSPVMQRVLALAAEVATSEATVLLRGESGTGKTLVAKAIHDWSPRANRLFTTISCPALSPQLLESELFGHAKGAFTGAVRDSAGRIASSDGGTLFLDEIGDLPLTLQPKLLRFIQDRVYERVGEAKTRQADVRIVAATNVDLEQAVRKGAFREDLFYRIQVVQLNMPPLRERPEDILPLAEQFLSELRKGKRVFGFGEEARKALQTYPWPGNVRELRNVVERALILCKNELVDLEHLPSNFVQPLVTANPEAGDAVTLDELEEQHIRRTLAKSKSLDEAAHSLGIDVATLWRRRKKYGI